MNNTLTPEEQELKRQKRREANKRANDRARQVPGVHGFEIFVREAYNPQAGIGTRKPDSDRSWCFLPKCYFSATALAKHVAQKESLAVTWGPLATMRVIDADAHGQADRMEALPRLWQAIQALHFGRGTLLPELTNGRVPEGVALDGVIITSPNGLHYMERTVDTSPGDRLAQDNARVLACFAKYDVTVRPGVIEVLPSTNGQSRLPLGYGCEFVYPAWGAVDLGTGLEVIASLGRVSRSFSDVEDCQALVSSPTPRVDTYYEGGGVGESSFGESWEPESMSEQPEVTHDHEHTGYTVAKSNPVADVMRKAQRHARKAVTSPTERVDTYYEGRKGGGEILGSESSEFVESMEALLVNGAGAGTRNAEFWNLCLYLRCTRGYTREQTSDRVTKWIETAPHQSKDLSSILSSKRNSALRLLARHLDRLDVGISSGRFYQVGNGHDSKKATASKAGDALLLCLTSKDQADSFYATGMEFLEGANGDSMIATMPEWIQKTLPVLVGAVAHWSRDGRIAISARTVQEYARTKKAKADPFDGKMRQAYQILIDLMVRFGVVSGITCKARKADRLAAVYETNTERHGQHDIHAEAKSDVDGAEPTEAATSADGTGEASERECLPNVAQGEQLRSKGSAHGLRCGSEPNATAADGQHRVRRAA